VLAISGCYGATYRLPPYGHLGDVTHSSAKKQQQHNIKTTMFRINKYYSRACAGKQQIVSSSNTRYNSGAAAPNNANYNFDNE
jgi:hypothetical protein